ncbi:MAG: hypothetical protein ACRDXB_06665 [Actinomycetes bacterium]
MDCARARPVKIAALHAAVTDDHTATKALARQHERRGDHLDGITGPVVTVAGGWCRR